MSSPREFRSWAVWWLVFALVAFVLAGFQWYSNHDWFWTVGFGIMGCMCVVFVPLSLRTASQIEARQRQWEKDRRDILQIVSRE